MLIYKVLRTTYMHSEIKVWSSQCNTRFTFTVSQLTSPFLTAFHRPSRPLHASQGPSRPTDITTAGRLGAEAITQCDKRSVGDTQTASSRSQVKFQECMSSTKAYIYI